MMPYHSYGLAKYRIDEARERAALVRLRKDTGRDPIRPVHQPTGVIDAVGHGLIALGSRLVSDPSDHTPPSDTRRAA
jgi:hypothetical protein